MDIEIDKANDRAVGTSVEFHVYEVQNSQVDRYNNVNGYFWSSVGGSVAGVFVVSLLFTKPLNATLSTFIVVLIICSILVVFPVFSIHFNVLVVINLIMGVGFAVDYCAHIGQTWAGASHLKPKERTVHTVNHAAKPVLKSGGSTVAAVLFLVLSSSLVLNTLFKCFAMMVFSGLWHALIYMPLALYLIETLMEKIFPRTELDTDSTDKDGENSGDKNRNNEDGAREGKSDHLKRPVAPPGSRPVAAVGTAVRRNVTDAII